MAPLEELGVVSRHIAEAALMLILLYPAVLIAPLVSLEQPEPHPAE